ncbi:MAG TPA: phospholipase D-like domain-containing protein [Aeromicrobium sp.]|nr:phospholipase D-like domain-containing protein [Aeromicrobium sp.]
MSYAGGVYLSSLGEFSVLFRRRLSLVLAAGALMVPLTGLVAPSFADQDSVPSAEQSAQTQGAAEDSSQGEASATTDATSPSAGTGAQAAGQPFGADYPIEIEANFARPYFDKGASNRDFALLNDLERLIRGSYLTPSGHLKPAATRRATVVFASNSRMEDSVRVGRELVKAASYGVQVRFIHPGTNISPASKRLSAQLNAQKTGSFKICSKGKSTACLSSVRGALMHSKILMVSSTYTRSSKPAVGAVWIGSSNFGGRSAERTYNNGTIVYNDKLLWTQMRGMWADMWAKRNVGSDYMAYVGKHSSRYGYAGATADGYTNNFATSGVFYSNLANFAVYAAPIRATPTNGRDPVLSTLNRIVPDDQCRIRLMENRFKYRRIALAYKLADLNNAGCRISIISFKDDWKKNRLEHCLQVLRVCKPILDVLKTARTQVDTAYAQTHDKSILIDAKLKPNPLIRQERTPDGRVWPTGGERVKLVLSGSANLTGSNLVASDELTTVTTDPDVYDSYIEHWRAITMTRAYGNFAY